MKLRSPISLALVRQGYVRGSREFKAAYQREWRKKPHAKEAHRKSWNQYYEKKKYSDPNWNASRIKEWRLKNPGKWKAVSDRATKHGVHNRFYQKHKTKLKKEKAAYGKKTRREKPGFGLRKQISETRKQGNLSKLIEKLKLEIDKLD